MERDPSRTVEAARRRIHRVERSVGRLLFAGVGFSMAYFLDAGRGRARRQQVVEVFRLARRSPPFAAAAEADRATADLPRIGWADLGPRATFQRAADGVRAGARA